MKKVFLHVGHGKTGTSATQTAFARLHSELKLHGVCYPEHPSFAAAKDGKISSGNLDGSRPDWLVGQVLPAIERNPTFQTYVFSNENLFWRLDTLFERIQEAENALSFHVLLSVHEPFEMLSSAYMQAVKRGGYTGTLSEYVKREGHIAHSAYLISRMRDLGVPFTVINYSKEKQRITKRIFEEIGVGPLFDQEQEKNLGTVNRSLSYVELQFVIFVNQIFGQAVGARVSDALVNQLPVVNAEPLKLKRNEAKEFRDRISDAVSMVNEFLASRDKILLKLPTSDESGSTTSLSDEQIRVVQDALSVRSMTDEDASLLYGVAMSYEAGRVLNEQQAIMLLRLAVKAKPSGPLIRAKLQELTSKF